MNDSTLDPSSLTKKGAMSHLSSSILRSLLCASLLSGSLACSGPQTQRRPPAWSRTTVEYGQGYIRLGIRFRWVAETDPAGAVIRTPDGGEAFVRIFACNKTTHEMRRIVRKRLRSLLIRAQIEKRKKLYTWRWRTRNPEEKVMGTALITHGPLLITVTSSSLTMADLIGIVKRTRLELPIPTIPSCFPLCGVDGSKCVPQEGDEEGREM